MATIDELVLETKIEIKQNDALSQLAQLQQELTQTKETMAQISQEMRNFTQPKGANGRFLPKSASEDFQRLSQRMRNLSVDANVTAKNIDTVTQHIQRLQSQASKPITVSSTIAPTVAAKVVASEMPVIPKWEQDIYGKGGYEGYRAAFYNRKAKQASNKELELEYKRMNGGDVTATTPNTTERIESALNRGLSMGMINAMQYRIRQIANTIEQRAQQNLQVAGNLEQTRNRLSVFSPTLANTVAQASAQYGTNCETDAVDMWRRFLAMSQGDTTRMNSLMLQYGQIASKGRADGTDIRPLLAAGVSREAIASAGGFDVNQFAEMQKAGKISFDMIRQAILNMTQTAIQSGGFLDTYSKSLNARMERMNTEMMLFREQFAETSLAIAQNRMELDKFTMTLTNNIPTWLQALAPAIGDFGNAIFNLLGILRFTQELSGGKIFGGLGKKLMIGGAAKTAVNVLAGGGGAANAATNGTLLAAGAGMAGLAVIAAPLAGAIVGLVNSHIAETKRAADIREEHLRLNPPQLNPRFNVYVDGNLQTGNQSVVRTGG